MIGLTPCSVVAVAVVAALATWSMMKMTTDRWNDGKKLTFDAWAKRSIDGREVKEVIKEHKVLVDIADKKDPAREMELAVHEMSKIIPEHVKFTKKFRFDRGFVGEHLVMLTLTYECLEFVNKDKPSEPLP